MLFFVYKRKYFGRRIQTLWEVAKTLAREKGDRTVLLGDTDRELKRNILYTIVTRLRTERDAIALGLVKDEYFGTPSSSACRTERNSQRATIPPSPPRHLDAVFRRLRS
jgi:hypothetical protein